MQIRMDTTKVNEQLRNLVTEQIPFVQAYTLTLLIKETREAVKVSMDKEMEGGPTNFTRTGMNVITAGKYDPTAVLYFKGDGYGDKSRGYVKEIMDGGRKVDPKGKYLKEPSQKNFAKYAPSFFTPQGNIKRNFYRMARNKGNKLYFIGIPKPGRSHWRDNENLLGVWRRDKDSGRLHMMVSLKRKSRQQRKTFNAKDTARRYAETHYERLFFDAFRYALTNL